MKEDIDVEKVMMEIRKRQERDSEQNHTISNLYFDKTELEDTILKMGRTSQVPWFFKISGNPISRFIKTLTRKMLIFFIHPMNEKQNKFNSNAFTVINQMKRYIEVSQDEMVKMQMKIDNLENEIRTLKSKGL